MMGIEKEEQLQTDRMRAHLFEKSFRNLPDQLSSKLVRRAVVYNGTAERRDANIEVLHYASFLSD